MKPLTTMNQSKSYIMGRVLNCIKNEAMDVLHACGFKDGIDFKYSFIHPHLLKFSIPIGVVSGVVETYIGLRPLTLLAFFALIFIELITGIAAAVWVKKEKLSNMKFKRFGLKLTVWVVLLFILYSFTKEYKEGTWAHFMWDAIHEGLFIYVCIEYLISVVEKLGIISGKVNSPLLRFIRGQVGKYTDFNEEDMPNESTGNKRGRK